MKIKMKLQFFLSLFTYIITEWSVHVKALSGPEFMKMPPDLKTFTNNTGTVIECLARGDPAPTVTWMGLNQIMVHNIPNLRTVWPNGTLVIEPFNAAQYRVDVHATTYQCKVSNSIGTILAPPTSLRAVGVQELEVQLYDEYVTSGNSVILTCVIPSFLRDLVTVTSWERDSTIHIYPSLHGDGKFHVISDGRLLVHNVQTTDSRQTFRCRVLHTLTGSTAVSNVARIIVNDPHERRLPRMITKDETIIANGESPLIVPCVAQGHPTPKYRWFLRSNLHNEPISLEGKHSILEGMKLHIEKGVLIVPSFTREMMTVESFTFVCEAYSEDGSSTMEVRVMKSIILRVSVTPKLLIVDSGSSGEFHCNIDGQWNGAVVSWYKNGNILPPSERNTFKDDGKLLEIRSVGTGDAGMFQCFVKLGTKVTQSSAELRLGASPPQFIYRFIQQTLTTGPSVSLKCIAKGSPTPVFDWFLDGFPLSHHHRVLVGQYVTLNGEVVSHVNISRSKVIDGGEYTCKAQNSVGAVSHSAPLHIYGPPHIRSMGTITTISGESFKVKCPVAGYPIASIKWRKGGRDLPLNKRHRTSGAVLEIDDVSKEYDEGDYLCVATDKHGRKASQTMSVKVVERLKVSSFSIPETLAAGSRMAVQCLVIQGDIPINMEWYHNGKKATLTPGITVTSLGEFVLTLLINKVEPHHEGNYTCRATSATAESSAEHSAFLHVHVAPYWKEDPKDVEVVKGKDGLLACLSEGYPVPKVTWRKTSQGNLYSQNLFHDTGRKAQRQESFPNGTLLIREITEADEGTYLCEVSNQVGKGLSAIITLKVHAPPHVQSKERIEARRGESVDLQCFASGDPPLSLTFSKDGHPVDPANVRYKNTKPPGNKFTSSNQETEKSIEEKVAEYHLQRVTPLDSGKYVCTATNPYGSQTFVTSLIVEDAPKIPLNLRSTEESSRSVVLQWSGQESDQSSVSYYLLLITKIDENETEETLKNLREIKISSDKRSYKLEKLHPHSSYQIKLVAVNSVGQSPPSEPLTITTEGEPPSEPPVNVRATPLSPRAVKVEWTVPDSQSWHGKLLGYYVAYRRKGEKDYLYEVARPSHGKTAEIIISGLQRYTTYVFAVKAFNSHGQGKLSAETFARTHEDIPHEAPSDLGCLPLTSSRIEVTWSPPSLNYANGEIMSYTVFYIPILTGSYILKSQVTSNPRIALGGLLSYTNYSVTVAASTRAGLGVASSPMLCLTEEDVPESPASIKSVVSGPTSVVVSWSPPKRSNGELTKYTLFFQPFKERKPKRRTVPPQTKWLEVTGLTEGREVTLWMTASTRVGESGPTRRVTVIPTKAVPASVNLVGSVIKASLGKDVLFPCPHSGYPQPKLSWRVNGITFPSPHLDLRRQNWEKQTDGSFLIRDLKSDDAGNFTCHVSNYHGSDEVTYYLQVSAPPSAYRIHAVSLSSDSFKISWEKNNFDSSPVNKMILTWKPGTGEWREVSLPWYLNSYTLCKLSCGTEYQLYVTAYNDVGAGEASSIVTMRTKGNRPISPPKEKVLYTNITTASLQLSAFSDSECPVNEYYVRLKSSFTHHWLIESGRLPGNYREYVLPNLNEKTKYTVEVSAKNEAGESKTVYSFYTSKLNQDEVYEVFGGELSVPSWNNEEDLYSDPAFIIPVIISCLALVVITGAIGICCLRRPVPNSSSTLKRNEKLVEIPNWNDQALYGTLRKVPPLPLINNDSKSMGSSSEYTDGEIHPYSTFQLKTYEDLTMSQSVSSSVQTYGRAPLHMKTCPNANQDKIQETQNTRIRPRSLSRGSDYARGRHLSSDDYENWYTDSDADTLPSSKASAYARSTYQPSGGRSAHHNKLYVASDVSALNSPEKDRKSIDRKQKGR